MAGVEFLTGDQTGLALYTTSVQQKDVLDTPSPPLDSTPSPWSDPLHVAYRHLQSGCTSDYVFYGLVGVGLLLLLLQIRSWWRMEVVVAKEKEG